MVNKFLSLEGSVMIVIVMILIRQRNLSAIKKLSFLFYNNVNIVRSLLGHTV